MIAVLLSTAVFGYLRLTTWLPINGEFYQPRIYDKSNPGFRSGETGFGTEIGYRATLRVLALFSPQGSNKMQRSRKLATVTGVIAVLAVSVWT